MKPFIKTLKIENRKIEVYGFIGHDVSFLESDSIEPSNRQILELDVIIKFKTQRETMIGGKITSISSSFVRIQGDNGKQYLKTFEHLVSEKTVLA